MTLPTAFFYLSCAVVLVAAAVALLTTRGPRTSLAFFLTSMISLVGVFISMGAHVIAVFHLLFCASLGLIFFFAIDLVGDFTDPAPSESRGSGLRWLVVVLGFVGASLMAGLLYQMTPEGRIGDPVGGAGSSFESIGVMVLVEQGVAVLGVGLLLLAAAIGAGFLANRGRAE